MSSKTALAVVQRVLAALDAGDWAEIGRHPGLHETHAYFPALRAAFPDLRHVVESRWLDAEGATVTCIAHIEGTHLAPYMGIPAAGKRVRFMVLLIDRVEGERIVEHWALSDFLSLFAQIGAVVAPGAPKQAP